MGNCFQRSQEAWYTPQSYPLALLHPGAAKENFKGRKYKGHEKGMEREDLDLAGWIIKRLTVTGQLSLHWRKYC